MATFVNECVEMLSVIFVFCIFWSYVQSYFHMFLVVYRSQSPYARSLQSKKWMTTHGFAFHTLNIVLTVCQRKSSRERACTRNAKRLRQLVGESIVVRSAFAEESGKYCVVLRKAATYLVTNKGNIQATWCHHVTHIVRFADVFMMHHVTWCIMRFMCMSFRFFVWRWRMAVSFRWATLWPRSPWLCHGPQTSCKAFLASTDSLRPNAKRKELLEKTKKKHQEKEKFESNVENYVFVDKNKMKLVRNRQSARFVLLRLPETNTKSA